MAEQSICDWCTRPFSLRADSSGTPRHCGPDCRQAALEQHRLRGIIEMAELDPTIALRELRRLARYADVTRRLTGP